MITKKEIENIEKRGKELKVHLGCGTKYKEGFVNVDVLDNIKVDLIHNLDIYPYPFKDNSASLIVANHIIEHLDNPMKFMNECYRILKPNGILHIECPIGGTYSSYHLDHKYNMSPYSFTIISGKRWGFQFPFKFKIVKMRIFMPLIKERIQFPWRLIYFNCFINNIFTKMMVELKKEDDF